jgi:hypothetical protein
MPFRGGLSLGLGVRPNAPRSLGEDGQILDVHASGQPSLPKNPSQFVEKQGGIPIEPFASVVRLTL